jgi:hypothetical protein
MGIMICNPLFGLGGGGGGAGIVGQHNVLPSASGGLFSKSGNDGDRRLLHWGGVPVGIWRYSASMGASGAWVPDGLIDLEVLGVNGATALGAAVDGRPSFNGVGSNALTWVATGARISGTGSTNQKGWWEWELFSADIDWGDIQSFDLQAHVVMSVGTVDCWGGSYLGEEQDNGANRNSTLFRYQFNNADVGVVFANVGNSTNVGVDLGLDVLIDGSYGQSQSGVEGIAMMSETGVVPTKLALATTTSGANHEAGDLFSRIGFNASAQTGTDAWTCDLKRIFVTINEKG